MKSLRKLKEAKKQRDNVFRRRGRPDGVLHGSEPVLFSVLFIQLIREKNFINVASLLAVAIPLIIASYLLQTY
jgi:hypothetical protein